jgi:diaminohydroxyphosphoribosylaminopyrimidine deaminase / 5-amino-6-(5-phosphoribosylamino)uracil reductase
MLQHKLFMQRCINLALLGAGNVAPNPMVGAVLVFNNLIIGEGYHQKYGAAHAEVNCINSVAENNKHLIPESTLYVSLEPCSHFGKTPPCVDLILASQIKKVVIGCTDSFKKVSGAGIEKLRQNNVEVTVNILEKECRTLNKAFFTYHEKQRPYIILKWAKTADGFIANETHNPLKITNEIIDSFTHKLRAHTNSIMVGNNTFLADKPALTVRHWIGNNPVKFIATTNEENISKIPDGFNPLLSATKNSNELIQQLYESNIQSILIEGGKNILQQFIDANLWDECFELTNLNQQINKGLSSPALHGAGQLIFSTNFENNSLQHYINTNNEFL